MFWLVTAAMLGVGPGILVARLLLPLPTTLDFEFLTAGGFCTALGVTSLFGARQMRTEVLRAGVWLCLFAAVVAGTVAFTVGESNTDWQAVEQDCSRDARSCVRYANHVMKFEAPRPIKERKALQYQRTACETHLHMASCEHVLREFPRVEKTRVPTTLRDAACRSGIQSSCSDSAGQQPSKTKAL